MKQIAIAMSVLVISACGGSSPEEDVSAPPVRSAESTTNISEPAATPAPAWSDLETLEESMNEISRNMKQLKTLVQQGDLANAHAPALDVQRQFEELQVRSRSFIGDSPGRFQAQADHSAVAARELAISLAPDSAPADPATVKRLIEELQGTCMACHGAYRGK